MSEQLVQVEDLCFRYPGSTKQTLQAVSFALAAGEVYGFLGPSGAGKSTTQKILYRLLHGYSGSVRIDGREIRDWGPELYTRTGIGFETPNLYQKLTGRENLAFALSLHRRRPSTDVDAAAERLGLTAALDTRVDTYSKGMRMRLAFIRAVLHQPALLFLDEPTSGLDPLWSRRVKDWILELKAQGTAVFLTTHAMELADELCDTVGFLVDGRLPAQGNPAVLKREHGQPGCVVTGRDINGAPCRQEVQYDQLRTAEPLQRFSVVESVIGGEQTLEQVFLTVTGRSLSEHHS